MREIRSKKGRVHIPRKGLEHILRHLYNNTCEGCTISKASHDRLQGTRVAEKMISKTEHCI